MIRGLCAAVWLAVLAGCVTTSTGGLPERATPDVRVGAHLDLARGYLEQRQWNRAREPLERALEINPRSTEALVLMAVLSENEGEPELADRYYRSALRSNPRHAQALNNYGTFLFAQGRHSEALVPLRTLVRDPAYRARAQAFENLGLAELAVGNRSEAKAAFERSLSLNAAQPQSLLELADFALQDGEIRAATDYFDGYRSLARQTSRSLCLGIRLAAATGNSDQQASYSIALRNLFPSSAEARSCAIPGAS